MKILSLALLLCLLAAPVASQSQSSKEAEVRSTVAGFLRAFDNLDWETFRKAFEDDSTVFYPRAIARRADGRSEIERNFRQVFDQIRDGKSKAPYMDLQPIGMKIQMLDDVAIATFQLEDRPGFVNRRTIVLHKSGSEWKIIHLHASEVATP
jgi:ketosteroid isomerase-like protein